MQPSGNTILVTGGGSGIGRELARELHEAGNRVIIAGRRQETLREVVASHPGMSALSLDLADTTAIKDFAAKVVQEHPELNVLVNNAGIMKLESYIEPNVVEATIATNLLGPIQLTAALLPHLLARQAATIINISSVLGFVPFAASPTYSATKAALHSWTVSLRHQLRSSSGIEVIEIIPPAVHTDLLGNLAASVHAMPLDAYIKETMTLLRRQPTPEEIYGERAEMICQILDSGKFAQIFGAFNM